MLEQFIYQNHQNEEMKFGSEGVFVNENSLRDYEWEIVSDNNRISNLQKRITRKEIENRKQALLEIYDNDKNIRILTKHL